ncbi:unnamed protein product, partial [Pylaiella littoralis]
RACSCLHRAVPPSASVPRHYCLCLLHASLVLCAPQIYYEVRCLMDVSWSPTVFASNRHSRASCSYHTMSCMPGALPAYQVYTCQTIPDTTCNSVGRPQPGSPPPPPPPQAFQTSAAC